MSESSYNELCTVCKHLVKTISNTGWHKDISHHRSLQSLAESASKYCGVCVVLLEQLKKNEYHHKPGIWEAIFPIKCECDTSAAIWQDSFEASFTSANYRVEGESMNLNVVITFAIAVDYSDKDNERLYAPPASTSSPQCWAQVNKWLKQCTETHDRCNASVPKAWAPTRLLDVGSLGDSCVRLVEVDANSTWAHPYATLSHCWGRSPVLKTTRSNHHQHLQGIGDLELPKTFREAISLLRSLQIRYLWLDTLCIVQDDISDWTREASMMSMVYRYAFLNIGATGAENSSQGCFWDREPAAIRPTYLTVDWITTKERDRVRARTYQVVPDHDTWARKLLEQPMNTRGWIIQERILSPRMVHFGNEQVFWECRGSVACETYPLGLPASLRQNTAVDIKTLGLGDEPRDDKWPSRYVFGRQASDHKMLWRLWNSLTALFKPITTQEVTLTSTLNPPSVYQDWDAVVELYSQGALTFPKDKLVALAGLANNISENGRNVLDDGYLAGLWHSSLPSHLLWTTNRTLTRTGDEYSPTRYAEYTAPSWSWASIEGRVSFAWCQRNYDMKEYLVTVEHAEVGLYDNLGRFGRVQSGSLTLSGPVASVSIDAASPLWMQRISPSAVGQQQHESISIPPGNNSEQEVFFDCADCDGTESTDLSEDGCGLRVLTFLPVVGLAKSATENEWVCGLVLEPNTAKAHAGQSLTAANTGGHYCRLGVFRTTRSRVCKILKNLPRQTVTIL